MASGLAHNGPDRPQHPTRGQSCPHHTLEPPLRTSLYTKGCGPGDGPGSGSGSPVGRKTRSGVQGRRAHRLLPAQVLIFFLGCATTWKGWGRGDQGPGQVEGWLGHSTQRAREKPRPREASPPPDPTTFFRIPKQSPSSGPPRVWDSTVPRAVHRRNTSATRSQTKRCPGCPHAPRCMSVTWVSCRHSVGPPVRTPR